MWRAQTNIAPHLLDASEHRARGYKKNRPAGGPGGMVIALNGL
jgi:hypothetical protein